jgi:iron complex transport system substrate-binding protein
MKKILLILLSFVLLMSFTACSDKNSAEQSDAKQTSDKGVSQDKNSDQNNKEGDSSKKENPENRVVATSVAIVEILDALKVNMVGVPTSTYELPSSVKDATKVGSPMSPDMEVIKSVDPTIVFSVATLKATLKDSFDAVNIKSEFVNLSSYDGLIESIKIIGEKTNTKDKAEELVKGIEERVNKVAKNKSDEKSNSVLIIFGASGNFQVATEKSYVGDLVKRAGAKNIIEDAKGPFIPVDIEYLASKNPDYILLMTHANPEESKAAFEKEFSVNPAWDNFDAVKKDKVFALDSKYFGMSANLFAPDAMEKLEEMFYGKE